MSLQKCVINADDWYVSNLLSVNISKSFVIIDGAQQAIHTNISYLAIYLKNEGLKKSNLNDI